MLHIVKRGDTLYSIAQAYGVSMTELAAANQLSDPSKLPIGMALVIPAPATPGRSIVVNGYAFPNISEAAFSGAAPYLTYLSVFACRAQSDGALVGMSDESVVRRAYVAGVAPVMTVTNQRESGGFSSDIARAVLTDAATSERLISNILQRLNERNYFGVNIDFEYVYEEDREAYTAFLTALGERLARVGYVFMVALAPKYSADQQGRLYTAHDYEAIGTIVDYAVIMTYEWGYTYGPPMAVAPIKEVERVLSYAVTAMPPEKVLMGMPNYGYNWALPYSEGRPARAIALAEAPTLAYSEYAAIQYDDRSQAPFFTYYDSNGAERVVWFDDPRSITARLELIDKYALGGVSYWNINTLYRPNWIVLGGMYSVEKAFS